ncbi:MAG: twin-arginine translocation signal domain-containing protein, partial [Anaerolineales bacterium]
MSKNLSRRDFLKLSGLSLGTLAFTPFVPQESDQDYGDIARVTIREVDVYGEPRDGAQIVGKRYRDQLVQIYYEMEPEDAPPFYNKLWYRVWGGYIHSSYLQKVKINYNLPLAEIQEDGQLAEVTVPYSQSYTFDQYN